MQATGSNEKSEATQSAMFIGVNLVKLLGGAQDLHNLELK